MTVPMDEKYVVFKRGTEPGEWSERGGLYLEDLEPIEDAVVIRRQDIFAAPALNAYACAIQVAISMDPTHSRMQRLREIADYFHQQAEASAHTNTRIPD